jgi:hypothetical protein
MESDAGFGTARTAAVECRSRILHAPNPAGWKRQPDLADSPHRACYHVPITCFSAPALPDLANRSQTNNNKHGGLVRASKPTSIQSMPSATGGIARLVCERMRGSSIPLTPLLSKAGLTVAQIDNRSARLTVRSQIRFLELAADALHDDLLGFHLARDYDLREIGLLYYVLASSEILNEALHRVVRYSGIANEGVSLKFYSTKEAAAIGLDYVGLDRQSDRQHRGSWQNSACRSLANRGERLCPRFPPASYRRQ